MEISILLTIFLISLLFGRLLFQDGKICLINKEQFEDSQSIQDTLINALFQWAVKLELGELYLLKNITTLNVLETTQSTPIQSRYLKFKG